MAREENNIYSNIEHVRTNMLWMDIKIVDPEMETLMKQINEEQTRLKEALREKLRLMKYDTDIVQKENEQIKLWLQSKGIQFDEKNYMIVKAQNETNVKAEPMNTVTGSNNYQEEQVTMQFAKEDHIETINNTTTVQPVNTNADVRQFQSCAQKPNDEIIKDDTSKKNRQMINKEIEHSDINNQNIKEEFDIDAEACVSKQVNLERAENISSNKKRAKRGMKRRRLLRKYKVTLKKKKNIKEKTDEVQNNNDIENEDQY